MSMSKCPVGVVLGTGFVGDRSDPITKFKSAEEVKPLLDLFRERGYDQIDTARGYSSGAPGSCELILSNTGLAPWAKIDTKVKSFPGAYSGQAILGSVQASLAALRISRINIEYLHAPDRTTPLEETCEAINTAYDAGYFSHFGISNYTPAEVEQIVSICEKNGWVKPSVYQGHYNLLVRGNEAELLPVLRKYKIAFYAYSPTAGGFLTGNVTRQTVNQEGSRWHNQTRAGKVFTDWYHRDELFEASEQVQKVSREAGISSHAAALRWLIHHSQLRHAHGDAIVIGASSVAQLSSNLDAVESGPLPDGVVKVIDQIWPKIKEVAPPFHL